MPRGCVLGDASDKTGVVGQGVGTEPIGSISNIFVALHASYPSFTTRIVQECDDEPLKSSFLIANEVFEPCKTH